MDTKIQRPFVTNMESYKLHINRSISGDVFLMSRLASNQTKFKAPIIDNVAWRHNLNYSVNITWKTEHK